MVREIKRVQANIKLSLPLLPKWLANAGTMVVFIANVCHETHFNTIYIGVCIALTIETSYHKYFRYLSNP